MQNRLSAKAIPTEELLEKIRDIEASDGRWALLSELCEEYAEFPKKVVLAKLRKLAKKGKITGCTCGCYGGFEVVW